MSEKKDKKVKEGAKDKKVADEKKLKDDIKEMESKKREAAMKYAKPQKKEDDKISFDKWHAMRVSDIPTIHRKEILRADFKGRGLKDKASAKDWDEALEKYGVKLKK
jgi:RNA recognition motif-containing protein